MHHTQTSSQTQSYIFFSFSFSFLCVWRSARRLFLSTWFLRSAQDDKTLTRFGAPPSGCAALPPWGRILVRAEYEFSPTGGGDRGAVWGVPRKTQFPFISTHEPRSTDSLLYRPFPGSLRLSSLCSFTLYHIFSLSQNEK